MKLIDIKQRLLESYFSSSTGEGLYEGQAVSTYADELLTIIDGSDYFNLVDDLQDFEDSTLAYRALIKEDIAFGYILEDDRALYMVTRRGKKFAAVNLTSPTKAVRACTLREVRDAFLQAHNHNPLVTFKVRTGRINLINQV